VSWAGVRRSTAQIADDRAIVVSALDEAGRPLRFDEILAAVIGSERSTQRDERNLHTDLRALRSAGKIVEAWDVWTSTYRLAVPEDLDADEDLADIAQLRAAWIPADSAAHPS
jgi:hypothetical protein